MFTRMCKSLELQKYMFLGHVHGCFRCYLVLLMCFDVEWGKVGKAGKMGLV